jgi:hypothetical protein
MGRSNRHHFATSPRRHERAEDDVSTTRSAGGKPLAGDGATRRSKPAGGDVDGASL